MSQEKNINFSEEKTQKIAVLIDADNASAKDIRNILEEITKYGESIVRRIYGNFVNINSQWKQAINDLAIKPMQQFSYTTGKNATDGFMIIDAMDLLYTNRFDGFCIVSSDSDFTALAIRIKEQGATVYGFGKKQTPEAFRNACSYFTYVENLADEEDLELVTQTTTDEQASLEKQEPETKILPLDKIKKIFDSNDNEWISLSLLGSKIKLLITDFDSRTYGFEKLSDLVKSYSDFFEYKSVLVNDRAWMMVKIKHLPENSIKRELLKLLNNQPDEWTIVTTIASKLKKSLGVDPKEYGFTNFVGLIKSFTDIIDFKTQSIKNQKHIFIRPKNKNS